MMEPAIIIHGGAWSVPDELVTANVAGMKEAARIGYRILTEGGSALDAVEAAVTCLENDKSLNAGTGGSLNAEGRLEMDAVIMEGKDLKAGGVAAVREIRNPIQMARKVLEETQNVLVVGDGACALADKLGIPRVDQEELLSDFSVEEYNTYIKNKEVDGSLTLGRNEDAADLKQHDTVGACALDVEGNLASGTSSGGIAAKLPGRVGDSPIVGCGCYCDNNIGAVSSTGHGESITKVCLSRHITGKMSEGLSAKDAAEAGLEYLTTRVNGFGGAIALSKDGDPGFAFSTKRMPWAIIKHGNLRFGIHKGEDFSENIGQL